LYVLLFVYEVETIQKQDRIELTMTSSPFLHIDEIIYSER
jgi:hypothetical protein